MRMICLHLLAQVTAAAIASAPTVARATPDWISQRPVEPGYAVGIGSAALQADDRHDGVTRALNQSLSAALADIAAQLQITVETATSSAHVENVDGLDQHFAQTTHAASAVELTGVEIAATWCSDSHCWTWARLDLSRRQTGLQHAEDLRRQRLQDLLSRLDDPQVPIATALAAGAEAVALAGPGSVAAARWQQRLAALTLEAIPVDSDNRAAVMARDAGRPAAAVPIRFEITPGQRSLPPTWTDASGRAWIDVSALQPPASVRACLHAGNTAGLPGHCVRFHIDAVRRRAHLTLNLSGDPAADRRAVQRELSSLLAAHGIDVTPVSDAADLSIHADLHTSPGANAGGVCFAFVDFTWTLTDTTIRATRAPHIRGAAITCGEAVLAALRSPEAQLPQAIATGRRLRLRVARGSGFDQE